MFAVIGLLKKPENSTLEEFRTWWREKHVPHVLQFRGLRHYAIYPIDEVRTSVVPNEYSSDVPYDGLAIIYFDSREAFMAALDSGEGNADKMHLRTGTSEVVVLHAEYVDILPWQAGTAPAIS
jgi:uncharacterized protein (TIGR02118 family)